MAGSKRERELARAKYERQQARRAQEQARKRRIWTIVAAVAGVALVAGAMLWLLRSSSSTPVAEPTTPPTAVPTATPSPGNSSPAASPSATSAQVCPPPPTSRQNDKSWSTAPAESIKPTGRYDLRLTTNCGQITIRMDQAKAPKTVNSMVFLTEQKYFDLTSCHRLTTAGIFVLQCGDPAGNGTGGPGYSIPDENLPAQTADNYPAGTVAMANAGPGTGGSQFFIVYDNTTLPPAYTIWGKVVAGLDVVKKVAAQGVQGGGTDGPPAQPISIITAVTTYDAAG